MTHITLVVLALATGCATMHRTAGQPLEVAAVAAPAGVGNLIMADAQAELTRAYAACLVNPASCGGLMPYYGGGNMAAELWRLQYLQAVRVQDAANSAAILDQALLRAYWEKDAALQASRADYAEVVGDP